MSEKKENDESDVDCTANRVASVTLESDSLSEAPKSFQSKRRRKIPRRAKAAPKMDVDAKVDLTPTEGKHILTLRTHQSESRLDTLIRYMFRQIHGVGQFDNGSLVGLLSLRSP